MNSKEQKIGLFGTILFHVLLLIVLIFMGFVTSLPLPEEEGILINFGNVESASGLIEPESNNNNKEVVEENKTTEVKSSNNTEKILTQNYEESVAVKSGNNNKKTETKVEEKKVEQEVKDPEVNKKALFPGNSSSNNNSSSDGNKTGQGNQGDIDGSKNSNNYEGGSSNGKNGISFSLTGRSTKALPKPVYNIQEEGKVVVDVTVDKKGNVIKAIPGAKGTTTADKILWESARKAALESKFNEKNDAAEEQRGTITYNFLLQ